MQKKLFSIGITKTTMEPHELIEHVHSREDFLDFVAALRADFQLNRSVWENASLDRYFEALRAWVEDRVEQTSEPPSWRTFAEMLYAAKLYE